MKALQRLMNESVQVQICPGSGPCPGSVTRCLVSLVASQWSKNPLENACWILFTPRFDSETTPLKPGLSSPRSSKSLPYLYIT